MLTEDLDSAYYVVQRFISGLGPQAKLPAQVADWCLKVRLAWDKSANGPETQDASRQSEVSYTVAQVAAEIHVSERHVRRLAKKGDLIGATRHGRDWLIPQTAVNGYMEAGK